VRLDHLLSKEYIVSVFRSPENARSYILESTTDDAVTNSLSAQALRVQGSAGPNRLGRLRKAARRLQTSFAHFVDGHEIFADA
jgi:hypothetical protein